MFGWLSDASSRASRSKRASRSGSLQRSREHLDGDVAAQLGVAGAIDLAHATGADPRRRSGTGQRAGRPGASPPCRRAARPASRESSSRGYPTPAATPPRGAAPRCRRTPRPGTPPAGWPATLARPRTPLSGVASCQGGASRAQILPPGERQGSRRPHHLATCAPGPLGVTGVRAICAAGACRRRHRLASGPARCEKIRHSFAPACSFT